MVSVSTITTASVVANASMALIYVSAIKTGTVIGNNLEKCP